MEQNNSTTKIKKYTHLSEKDRYKMEALLDSKRSAREIADASTDGRVTLYSYQGLGHGTDMLAAKPDLAEVIIQFLKAKGDGYRGEIKAMARGRLKLSGSTYVGEGASWELTIEGSGAVQARHTGNRGNGEMFKSSASAGVDPGQIKNLFEKITPVIEKYRTQIRAGYSDGREDSGVEKRIYVLSRSGQKSFRSETIGLGGLLDAWLNVEDSHPAFQEIKKLVLQSGFVEENSNNLPWPKTSKKS